MLRTSFKFRLTFWYAFLLTVLLSAFAFWMYQEFSRALYRDVDAKLTREVHALETSFEDYRGPVLAKLQAVLGKSPRKSPFDLPQEIKQSLSSQLKKWEKDRRLVTRNVLMIRFVTMNNELMFSNVRGWQKEIIFPDFERDSLFIEEGKSFQTIHFRGRPIRLFYYQVETPAHRRLFVIEVGDSIHELKDYLRRLLIIILISIPGAVAAACFAGWFLASRFLKPVDLMIDEARQITAAYLKRRLPRSRSGDELDRLAETLNEMMDRIEESTRAIQDFSSDISHELKTPLAIIRGEIDLALRRERSSEERAQTLRTVEGEVNELILLVDDLMLLVRSDANQLRFEKRTLSLKNLLEQVLQRFRDRAKIKKINLSFLCERDFEIQGDEVYTKRLFNNLVDNAIKFTPEGGWVKVRLLALSEQVKVEIEDNGIGIDAAMQPKVFSRFFRTDQARSYEGSGLGLNISQAIARAHEGRIELSSSPGKGTLLSVTFPIKSSQ